jgi:DNA-binding Lrp family transcriptional regulator
VSVVQVMSGHDARENLLLQLLSDNSRTTITAITKKFGCSRVTASKIISKVEKQFGIRYTLEINEDKLAPSERHIMLLKFKKSPAPKSLEAFFKNDINTEAAYLANNNRSLVIFSRTRDPSAYLAWEQKLSNSLFKYKPIIRHSEVIKSNFGFFPLSNNFVDYISKDVKITQKDKAILSLLNQDSRINYNELSRKTGLNEDTIHYRVYRLQKKGIIKRFTIAVQNPPLTHIGAYFADYSYGSHPDKYDEFATQISSQDKKDSPLSSLQVAALTRGSYRFFLMGAFKDKKEATQKFVQKHKKTFGADAAIYSADNIKVIKGILPFRSLNTT